jgi:polysaccharide export outer membrane protein
MGRSVLIFLRLSTIAGALALLIVCIRAAGAQEATPDPAQPKPPQTYGFVPIQNSAPDSQPYGIKPIPGYTPPEASPQPSQQQLPPQQLSPEQSQPPQQLRGDFEGAQSVPVSEPQNSYGYVPLRQPVPLPPAQQPQLRTSMPAHAADEMLSEGRQPYDPRGNYQDTAGAERINAGYRLGPGDKIRVTVFGQTDLSGEYQVDGSGMVRLPLIGTLRATGTTAPILEQGITSALADGYLKNPRVNVEIATYRPFYIIGAVNRPGQYAYVDNMDALNAVALAGGFTDQAIQSTLYIRHEGSTVEEPVETRERTHVAPGDVIRVKTSIFWDAMNLFSPVAGPAAIAAAALH